MKLDQIIDMLNGFKSDLEGNGGGFEVMIRIHTGNEQITVPIRGFSIEIEGCDRNSIGPIGLYPRTIIIKGSKSEHSAAYGATRRRTSKARKPPGGLPEDQSQRTA